jgi:hypothetical protein
MEVSSVTGHLQEIAEMRSIQHVPIHGRVATNDEFLKIIGNVPALISLE